VRRSSAIRTAAWLAVGTGVALPLLRRRRRIPAPVVLAGAAAAPIALCVAAPRSRTRDVATIVLQMLAYLAAYEMPNDDPDKLRARVRVDYPVTIDRMLGFGRLPSLRLQRLAAPGRVRPAEQVLVWAHWIWFVVPHSTIVYMMVRHPERVQRSAVMMYSVYDVGLIGYWALPTAPPWFADEHGRLGAPGEPPLRRMMVEHGQAFWKDGWQPLYSLLGGNPLAAMPSLHFATSLMAARLLSETGALPGAVGWTYALTLGFALVYLGEHYAVDLLAGAALTEGVRRIGPRFTPLLQAVSRRIGALEAAAHA
jgi:membrane-associated phospholipid phosphatase